MRNIKVYLLVVMVFFVNQIFAYVNPENKDFEHINRLMIEEEKAFNQYFEDKFDDRFFKSYFDPYREMENIQKDISKLMNKSDALVFDTRFNKWANAKFGHNLTCKIEQKEKIKEILTVITLPKDFDVNNIKATIENGVVSIETIKNSENIKEENTPKTKYYSSFYFLRQFSIPKGINEKEIKINKEKNKIIINMPKISKI